MGTFTYPIEVISADGSRSETVDATVDTGSTYTCLPSDLLGRLGVAPRRRIQSELADGSIVEDAVGEARVRVEGIETTTIVVFVDEAAPTLLGAYTLEGALLVVDPVRQRLAPTHALRYARRQR
ncbi:MAG: retroviral-like aspartic protease family protein [Chloroflexi bacterium]|nr:retroviral-like aspartic protease family protein [Chloroflexota bacterium]